MKIIIAGAYAIGTHLARLLSRSNEEITLIDESEERLASIGSDYDQSTFRPAVTRKYYAIFEPAKQSTIRTTRRGELETKIKNSTYGEHVNELVISGPLNDDDLMKNTCTYGITHDTKMINSSSAFR